MAKFFMYGKYSEDAVSDISKDHTAKALDAIAKAGGKVNSMYALLGRYDIVLIADFPGVAEVMKSSIALNKLTNTVFTSFPAVSIEEFDKIMV